MRYLVLFLLSFVIWASLIASITYIYDPMHKTYHADNRRDIPDMGQSAQDVLDMKLALFLKHPQPNIIIGNSRPYKGLRAEFFGDDWFNFSVPGASTRDFDSLVRFLLNCAAVPEIKKVIITQDLSVYDFKRGGSLGQNFDISRHTRKCDADTKLQKVTKDILTHPTYFLDVTNIWKIITGGEKKYNLQGSYFDYPERLSQNIVRNNSFSKLEDYTAKGWGVIGHVDGQDAVMQSYRLALPFLESLSEHLSDASVAFDFVWLPIHSSLYQVKVDKGLHKIAAELQVQSAEIAWANKGAFVFLVSDQPIIDPIDQLTKSIDAFAFIEPSHFTSAFGQNIAREILSPENRVGSVKELVELQDAAHEYLTERQ